MRRVADCMQRMTFGQVNEATPQPRWPQRREMILRAAQLTMDKLFSFLRGSMGSGKVSASGKNEPHMICDDVICIWQVELTQAACGHIGQDESRAHGNKWVAIRLFSVSWANPIGQAMDS